MNSFISNLGVSQAIVLRSGRIAIVVGTVLNLINQSDALFGSGESDLTKAGLTYCVPFFVAMYGALSATNDSRKTTLGQDQRHQTNEDRRTRAPQPPE
ncbi:nitrate/nitrite transporter NrtS [uncultured Roseovarius sp.]|uniref:nitrate/nitrite transporter NrtS n=1 Tax=uncultured Roseovarius sp. TaxID=293344 RepID=UPI00260AC5F3|nr:nitrate/nitrite transporter NrtS [uncultured Roseovarius sp.]